MHPKFILTCCDIQTFLDIFAKTLIQSQSYQPKDIGIKASGTCSMASLGASNVQEFNIFSQSYVLADYDILVIQITII